MNARVAPARREVESRARAVRAQGDIMRHLLVSSVLRMLEVAKGEDLRVGATLAKRFRLRRVVGEGGMGVVWAARDLEANEDVAIKVLKRTGEAGARHEKRLLREARMMARLSHPNIATMHGVHETEDGTPFLVMDLLQGESLRERIDREGALPFAEVASWMTQVVAAVGAAHAADVVHRDLKPENIFLVKRSSGEPRVKVLDFGIAKSLPRDAAASEDASLTATGAMLGTPYYMAPEQIFGDDDVDARADVWALGVVLYECLTGTRPTQATGVGQVIKRIVSETIPPLREQMSVPLEVSDLAQRMLGRDRATRPSLDEVLAGLKVLAAAKTSSPVRAAVRADATTLDSVEIVSALPATPTTTTKATANRRRWLAPAIVAVVLVMVGATRWSGAEASPVESPVHAAEPPVVPVEPPSAEPIPPPPPPVVSVVTKLPVPQRRAEPRATPSVSAAPSPPPPATSEIPSLERR